jgi:hypothetical protein
MAKPPTLQNGRLGRRSLPFVTLEMEAQKPKRREKTFRMTWQLAAEESRRI